MVTADSLDDAANLYRIDSLLPVASAMSTTGDQLKCVHPTGVGVVSPPEDSMTMIPTSPAACAGHGMVLTPDEACAAPTATRDAGMVRLPDGRADDGHGSANND